jgi:hypothetical protein
MQLRTTGSRIIPQDRPSTEQPRLRQRHGQSGLKGYRRILTFRPVPLDQRSILGLPTDACGPGHLEGRNTTRFFRGRLKTSSVMRTSLFNLNLMV